MEKYQSENLQQGMHLVAWELEHLARPESLDRSENEDNAYTIYLIANVLLPDKTMQLFFIIL
jgi:hypothetical protein